MGNIYSTSNVLLDTFAEVFYALKANTMRVREDVKFKVQIRRLCKFLGLNENEAAIFTVAFCCYHDCDQRPVSISMLGDCINVSPMVILSFMDEFNALEDKGFLQVDSSPKDNGSVSKFYRVPENVIKAIIRNDKLALKEALKHSFKELTYAESIKEKKLFYKENVAAQVEKLCTYLEKERLDEIQNRLSEKAMPTGVCIMFYGDSGTGKTETVYQLAKKTGRAIYKVDVASTISCWHGGTERNLAAVFNKYEQLCKTSRENGELLPILLFNEADAIFGKRLQNPMHGAEIDENHVQNVLLEYLERQTGIIIATTNMAGNFDDAFERRFLFKVLFENPNLEIKKKIWKSKIEWLNTESVSKLASTYALSGGQIENVARKATMDEVLNGKRSSVKDLEKYCQTEKLEQERKNKIGFGC